MTVSKDNADYTISFGPKVFSDVVSKTRRFIGSKPGPVTIEVRKRKGNKYLRFKQSSPMATAVIDLMDGFVLKTKESEPFFACVSDEWLSSFAGRSTEEVILLKSGTDITLRTGKRHASTKEAEAPGDLNEGEGSGSSQAVMMAPFVKPGKKILGMKSFFTDRPCAATYGEYEGSVFFMVNDQYHGIILKVENKSIRSNMMLTTNASAFKPILESDAEEHVCTVEDGRLVIVSPSARYWMPVFDPAAAPSLEEASFVMSVKPKNYIIIDTKEAQDISRMVSKGSDGTQVFTLEYNGETLNVEYNSSSSSAGAEISVSKSKSGKWKSVSIDPNLFADIVTKMESEKIRLWKADNMFFISEVGSDIPKTGFAIIMADNG